MLVLLHPTLLEDPGINAVAVVASLNILPVAQVSDAVDPAVAAAYALDDLEHGKYEG